MTGPGPSGEAVEQRFWAETLVLLGPVFLAFWGLFAVAALTGGGTQIGAFLGISWLIFATAGAFTPYVAVVRPDGSLTFRALLRTVRTTEAAVFRIGKTRHGRGGALYVFYFDDRKASLGLFGGQRLAQFLRDRDPTIAGP